MIFQETLIDTFLKDKSDYKSEFLTDIAKTGTYKGNMENFIDLMKNWENHKINITVNN
jgi:hypothetical protein